MPLVLILNVFYFLIEWGSALRKCTHEPRLRFSFLC